MGLDGAADEPGAQEPGQRQADDLGHRDLPQRAVRVMISFLRRLGRDRRGVSAVEFALIAPAMVASYFGMAEITQALLAERKAAHAASAIGDLVSQSSSVSTADITDIFSIASTIMQPYTTTTPKMRVSSVTADSGG